MQVKVLYFGVLKDRFGTAEELVELPGEGSVGELLGLLRARTSNFAKGNGMADGMQEERLWRSLAVAVNREYASTSVVLGDGDEVALLPPVSGGSFAESGTARAASFARKGWGAARCSSARVVRGQTRFANRMSGRHES